MYLSYGSFSRISCSVFSTKQIYKYKKILSNFSSQNKGFQAPKSKKNIYRFECNGYNVYLTGAKIRTLSLITKNNQI